jgi:hypothetical protein
MAMIRVVVAGAGLAGCAAAGAAARAGARVTLLERADLLGGWGLLAGRVDHNYITVREELRLMGGDDIFRLIDECTLHKEVKFPWPKPQGAIKTIYNTLKLDPKLRKYMSDMNIEIRLLSRAVDVIKEGSEIESLILASGENVSGDAFVDVTGGTGGIKNCIRYGYGCVMCFQRCPAFGDRVSIAAKAGVKEVKGKKPDGSLGPITAAFSLVKESLAPQLRQQLESVGIVCIPVPPELINYKRTENITASANIDSGFAENVVLVDIGAHAKRIAGGFTPLNELRKIPGLERAIFADPYAGTLGNGIRYMAITPRGNDLSVAGLSNLFVASEKLGVNGVGEVIATGVMAGHNAVRRALNMESLMLPCTTMLGSFIAYINQNWTKEEWLRSRFHIYEGPYFRLARDSGIFTEDKIAIKARIEEHGLEEILSRRIASW